MKRLLISIPGLALLTFLALKDAPAEGPPRKPAKSLGLSAAPAQGQTREQQSSDEAGCYDTARVDTAFDPRSPIVGLETRSTRPIGTYRGRSPRAVAVERAADDSRAAESRRQAGVEEFKGAFSRCLEKKGYTVK